jgi:glycosyltransferase involved in cell wall biosynthesis
VTRALLVCPEPLGHGQPAGIGIRFLEMAKALLADGHAVTLLSRDAGPVVGCVCAAITPQTLESYSRQSDVAIVQGHAANDFFAHARPLATVVDLYDPFIIENLHYHASRGSEVFTHDHATLINSLTRGDLFLCASEAQRFFYLGLLLAVGRVNPVAFASDASFDALLRIAPFGVQPARPAAKRNTQSPAILFGGIYDWYDPILAIQAVIRLRARRPGTTLTFNTHPNPQLTPQSATTRAMGYVARQGAELFVRFVPWVDYGERGTFFDQFALALLTFPQSVESALAMRTRVYDYLWGGLPIVTSSAPGTDEIVVRYQAGTVVKSEHPDDFADALIRLLEPASYDAASAGASRFVEENQWPHTLRPLLEFVRAPKLYPNKQIFTTERAVPPAQSSVVEKIMRRFGVRS